MYIKRAARIFVAVIIAVAFFQPRLYAFAQDVELTIDVQGKSYTFYEPEIGCYNGVYYLKNVESLIDGIYLDTLIRQRDAVMRFNRETTKYPLSIVSECNGIEVDKGYLLSEIPKCLNSGKVRLKAVMRHLSPEVTAEKLLRESYEIATFSTELATSATGRTQNIKLAVGTLNGTIIEPDEVFSFNQTVGERTEERGYSNAKIIMDGKFIDGVGGGVCQVSTTLYNCALLCGLQIVECRAHSLSVSYVEPSFDAMVSCFSDLKIRNNYEGNVYIQAFVDDNRLVFRLYGVKRLYEYRRISIVTERIEPQIEYIGDGCASDEGLSREIVVNPKEGLKSEGYIARFRSGCEVDRYKIRSDSYAKIDGIVKIAKNDINSFAIREINRL